MDSELKEYVDGVAEFESEEARTRMVNIIKAALTQGIPSIAVQSPFVEELLPQEFHLNEENTEKLLDFFIRNITKFELSSIKEHLLTHYD